MNDPIDAFYGTAYGGGVTYVAVDNFERQSGERFVPRVPDEHLNPIATLNEQANHVVADESGGASDEGVHGSAEFGVRNDDGVRFQGGTDKGEGGTDKRAPRPLVSGG